MHLSRRTLLEHAVLGAGAALGALLPSWARSNARGTPAAATELGGDDIALTIGHTPVTIDGRTTHAVTINGTVPGPLLRLKEGQRVRISITNTLDVNTSIH